MANEEIKDLLKKEKLSNIEKLYDYVFLTKGINDSEFFKKFENVVIGYALGECRKKQEQFKIEGMTNGIN